jgi:hypothetical protein
MMSPDYPKASTDSLDKHRLIDVPGLPGFVSPDSVSPDSFGRRRGAE